VIYFVRCVGYGPVKIGKTDDLPLRLYQLRRTYGVPLEPFRQIEQRMDRWGEAWLHWHFRSAHIRGEWFSYDPEMATVELPRYDDMSPDIPTLARGGGRGRCRPDYVECIRAMIVAAQT
jgi:hypothetical protein